MSGQQTRLIGLWLSAGVAAACASGALAQTDATYLITFSGVVTPQNPTMTVGLWAMWVDPNEDHVFAGGNYDLDAGDGEFVSGANILNGHNSTIGVLAGSTVTGAVNGQLHLPFNFNIYGKKDNPILLATYEWTTTNFAPRTISFTTSNTSHFIVAEWSWGATIDLYPNQFSPGKAMYVIPTPSTLVLAVCGGIVVTRRRRIRSMNHV